MKESLGSYRIVYTFLCIYLVDGNVKNEEMNLLFSVCSICTDCSLHPNTSLYNKTIPLYCVNTQINGVIV